MIILVGYAERTESRAALDVAVREAKLRGATLEILQTSMDGPVESPSQVREWSQRMEQARQRGAELERSLADDGIEARFRLVADSAEGPAAEMLAAASALPADLIVIGLRRRSAVGKLVLGSVAQDVLLQADCPVLAVKAPATNDRDE